MSQVSRPVQILLAVTLLFAALWFVVLRPKSPTGGGSAAAPATPAQTTPAAPGTAGLKGAIDKAHGAVATASGDAERAARSSADGIPVTADGAGATSGSSSAAAAAGASARTGRPHVHGGALSAHRAAESGPVRTVGTALRHHKAVAIAFVDPNTADARAVAQELHHVSDFGGRAVTLAVPIAQLSDYGFITNEVQVTVAPTVVIVDPRRRATTIVGFTDRGEIEQRLADALAAKPRR